MQTAHPRTSSNTSSRTTPCSRCCSSGIRTCSNGSWRRFSALRRTVFRNL
jgi:hypothetical protein